MSVLGASSPAICRPSANDRIDALRAICRDRKRQIEKARGELRAAAEELHALELEQRRLGIGFVATPKA